MFLGDEAGDLGLAPDGPNSLFTSNHFYSDVITSRLSKSCNIVQACRSSHGFICYVNLPNDG